MVDNANQSVFVFERRYEDSHLVFVFNMTPNYYEEYDMLSRIDLNTIDSTCMDIHG